MWPWPSRPWHWQAPIIEHLRMCWQAWRVFSTPSEQWQEAEMQFFISVYEDETE